MAIAETINSPQESGQGADSRCNAAVIQRNWFRSWNHLAGLDRANEYRHRMEAVRHSIGIINEDACEGSRAVTILTDPRSDTRTKKQSWSSHA